MEIKGTALLAIRDFVKINHSDKFERWLKMLSEDSKQIYENSIDSTKWYPVESAAIEPTQKISEILFTSDFKIGAWECGKYSAQKGLTGIYKIFVKASSPSFIISRAKDIMARYYRPCEIKVVKNISKSVVLHMTSEENFDPIIEYRIAGWIQKALEISGSKEVVVDIPKSMSKGYEYTEFDIHWS